MYIILVLKFYKEWCQAKKKSNFNLILKCFDQNYVKYKKSWVDFVLKLQFSSLLLFI